MSTKSKRQFSQNEQEDMLAEFYNNIITGEDKPSTEYQKKFLLQLLNTKIAKIESKTKNIKLLNFALNITVMVFSGLTTILLGLKFNDNELLTKNLNNAALIISASISFLSGLAVFWDTENYWIRNKIMLNRLKEIRYEYVFYLAGNSEITTASILPFLTKFLDSLGDEYWEKFLKSEKEK
ncbi:SLATT domain-containing protein [Aequorivita capsosiphonis]|uniref:SLATT domain-containing protein n=1 Tax=Aequorivita capsosiphonis TaxID=487317 RepID=UPI00047A5538|nr:SLATT domain-containing protein [Aequorivita capsosiphonis]